MDSWIPSILYLNEIYKESAFALLLLRIWETFTNLGIPLMRWVLLLFLFLMHNTGNIYIKSGQLEGMCQNLIQLLSTCQGLCQSKMTHGS